MCRALRGKMASSSSSPSSTAATAAAAANQQQQPESQVDLVMQRQQQELIKLLAQHFHHQFYQMAAASQSAAAANIEQSQNHLHSPPSDSANIIGTNQQSAQQQRQLPIHLPYQQQQQQQRAHYSNNDALTYETSPNGHHSTSTSSSNHQLSTHTNNNQPLRSQSNTTGPLPPGGCNATSTVAAAESRDYLDFGNQNLANSYPINDLNLFNALGLNLTNNQLVLSLQQQQHSLLQAAALRQFELRNEYETHCQRNRRNSDELLISCNLTKGKEDHQRDNQRQQQQQLADRKHNLLKFSINTILGSSASPTTCDNNNGNNFTGPIKSNNIFNMQSTEMSSPDGLVSRVSGLDREKMDLIESEQQLDVAATDCDHIESSSDSSSINASTSSSLPQSANLLTQSLQAPSADHRCAKIVNNVNSFSQVVGPQQHPLRQQLSQPAQQQQQHQQHHFHHQPLPFLPGSTAFPWTVAARGKPRRGMMRRAVFSDSQRVGLEKRFQLQKYISKPDRKKLAEKLGLRDSQVKIWFQNRRMKWRNSKERELLSAGGSREQTLPTRNNPNPDLSDVGETIKRISNSATSTPTVP